MGISLSEIHAKLAAGDLPDNRTWRLPTHYELFALMHPYQESLQGRVYPILNNTFFPYNTRYADGAITYPTVNRGAHPEADGLLGLMSLREANININIWSSTVDSAIRCIRQ